MALKSFFISCILPSLIFLILGITPLIEAQNKYGYEYPKVLFFICSAIVALLFFEIAPAKIRQNLFSKSFLTILGVLFLASISFSSLFLPQPLQGLVGRYPYFQGIILYLFLFLFSLLVKNCNVSLRKYSYIFALSIPMIALVAVGQWVSLHLFHQPIVTYSGRVVSTFGQPNLFSGYLVMVLPMFFLLLEKVKGKKKIFFGVPMIVILLGVVVSMSRFALVMVGVLAIISAIFYLRRSRYFIKALIAMGAVVIIIGCIALPKIIQSEFIDPYNYRWLMLNTPEKRVYIWQVAVSQGFKKPIFGYGLDNFQQVYTSYFTDAPKEASYYSRKVLVVDRAHNYILDIFVYAGIVGVVLWILLVGNVFVRLRKNKWLALSLVLYVIFVFVHPQSIMHLIFFWFLAGISAKPANYFNE